MCLQTVSFLKFVGFVKYKTQYVVICIPNHIIYCVCLQEVIQNLALSHKYGFSRLSFEDFSFNDNFAVIAGRLPFLEFDTKHSSAPWIMPLLSHAVSNANWMQLLTGKLSNWTAATSSVSAISLRILEKCLVLVWQIVFSIYRNPILSSIGLLADGSTCRSFFSSSSGLRSRGVPTILPTIFRVEAFWISWISLEFTLRLSSNVFLDLLCNFPAPHCDVN